MTIKIEMSSNECEVLKNTKCVLEGISNQLEKVRYDMVDVDFENTEDISDIREIRNLCNDILNVLEG